MRTLKRWLAALLAFGIVFAPLSGQITPGAVTASAGHTGGGGGGGNSGGLGGGGDG